MGRRHFTPREAGPLAPLTGGSDPRFLPRLRGTTESGVARRARGVPHGGGLGLGTLRVFFPRRSISHDELDPSPPGTFRRDPDERFQTLKRFRPTAASEREGSGPLDPAPRTLRRGEMDELILSTATESRFG